MDFENRDLLNQTRDLIAHTRGEIYRLRQEIRAARETVVRSVKLLTGPQRTPRRAGNRSDIVGKTLLFRLGLAYCCSQPCRQRAGAAPSKYRPRAAMAAPFP